MTNFKRKPVILNLVCRAGLFAFHWYLCIAVHIPSKLSMLKPRRKKTKEGKLEPCLAGQLTKMFVLKNKQ
jgi:hypothetical protein